MTKKPLRVNMLVAAARDLQPLYCTQFIHATAKVTGITQQGTTPHPGPPSWIIEFEIDGFGHGRALFCFAEGQYRLYALLQYTGPGIAYTEFYRGRHGNEELITLMQPLMEGKLLPLLNAELEAKLRKFAAPVT